MNNLTVEAKAKELAEQLSHSAPRALWEPILAAALAVCARESREGALKEAAKAYMAHYHVAGEQNKDCCFACGRDIRHGIHLRANETKESRLAALERAVGEKGSQ